MFIIESNSNPTSAEISSNNSNSNSSIDKLFLELDQNIDSNNNIYSNSNSNSNRSNNYRNASNTVSPEKEEEIHKQLKEIRAGMGYGFSKLFPSLSKWYKFQPSDILERTKNDTREMYEYIFSPGKQRNLLYMGECIWIDIHIE